MNRKRTAMVGIVAFVCGAISFFQARSTTLSGKQSDNWLCNAPSSILAFEEDFEKETTGLITTLMSEQKSLGSELEDPCTPNEVVLESAEKVIGAHERLMKRVGEHIVKLRGKLSKENREYLMRLCAETVRGPVRRLEGRGDGRGMRNGSGMGYGYGRGSGRGAGQGYGMRREIRNRLENLLQLDKEQASRLNQEDAVFETESTKLRDLLFVERSKLLAMFEDSNTSGGQLLQQIEKLIAAHNSIERRVVRHVLVLRPYLTGEQQKWLIGLCLRNMENSPSDSEPE